MSSSHRQILRATAIVGGASALNIVIGLARNKASALLLGPSGVGVIGLLLNLVTAAAGLAGLGVGMSGVRALAGAATDEHRFQVRRAIEWLTVLLAAGGAMAVWLMRQPLARLVLDRDTLGWQIGWLAPAVAFTVGSAVQLAILNGLRRLGDFARVQVMGSLLGSACGIAALLWRGAEGILAYVIAAPLATALIGSFYTSRAPSPVHPVSQHGTLKEMKGLIGLGVPLMLGGLAQPVGLLVVRIVLGERLGLDSLGFFTAAWTLSVTYVGFILSAMGTDYFARLSGVIDDHAAARRLVNDQTEIALLLATPVMLIVQGLAPWLLSALYSAPFRAAADVLRWQIVGDVLKIAAWPLAFVVLAQRRGRLFMGIESLHVLVLVGFVALTVAPLGLSSTGIGYLVAYLAYLPVTFLLVRRAIGFRVALGVARRGLVLLIGVAAVGLAGAAWPLLGACLGLALGLATAASSIIHLQHSLPRLSPLARRLETMLPRAIRTWIAAENP